MSTAAVWHAGKKVGSREKMDSWKAGTQLEELGCGSGVGLK